MFALSPDCRYVVPPYYVCPRLIFAFPTYVCFLDRYLYVPDRNVFQPMYASLYVPRPMDVYPPVRFPDRYVLTRALPDLWP